MSGIADRNSPIDDDTADAPLPEGYLPLFRSSPFLDATGPYFYKPLDEGFSVGMRIGRKHTNVSGTMHGGLIATLSDVSLGYVTATSAQPPLQMVTANLSIDYVGAAKLGEWVEARVEVLKSGARLCFANALISAEGRLVARASAVFAVVGNAKA
jgi:uncharacterized protein (TIGR00369 family)